MHLNFTITLILLLIYFLTETFSWEEQEHRLLVNLSFDSTLSFCGIDYNDTLISFPGKSGKILLNKSLWNNQSFGNISVSFSGDDISQARCHKKGYTIRQQLESLYSSVIDKAWQEIRKDPGDIKYIEDSNQSVVYNYLLYHLIALKFVKLSAEENNNFENNLRNALITEAAALSYLSDAFSAGHMFLLVSDFLAPLNRLNNHLAHDYYCTEGVYVINSRGDQWQTFGDKLLQWYPYSFNQVLEACRVSLQEFFLVYFASLKNTEIPLKLINWVRSFSDGLTPAEISNLWLAINNGDYYYSKIKMPALLYIPIPVAAAWSIRTEKKDKFGIFQRKYYPQLYEEKFHDPDLNEIDIGFLYLKNSVPEWMIPSFLPNDTLQNFIRYDPDIASVRYIQNRYFAPSYRGYLIQAGGTRVFTNGKNLFGASLGFGWGFKDEFLFVLNKPSFIFSVMKLINEHEFIAMVDFGLGINIPVFNIIKPYIEIGYANGFQISDNGSTGKCAFGFDSETVPLAFTSAGLTFRLKYQFIFFKETMQSPVLEIILH